MTAYTKTKIFRIFEKRGVRREKPLPPFPSEERICVKCGEKTFLSIGQIKYHKCKK